MGAEAVSRKWRKTEGGHKRGHSNMTHWEHTEAIKSATKIERRRQDKEVVNESLRAAREARRGER